METSRTPSTSKIGRNDPCPCGSGSKYKRCCQSKAEATGRAPLVRALSSPPTQVPAGARVVERNGDLFLVSKGITDERLASMLPYFDRRDCSPALAGKMQTFIKPMLDEANGSHELVERVWTLGGLFWNIALMRDDAARKKGLDEAERFFSGKGREQFRELAAFMLRRHERMFPEMHERRAP